MSQQLINHNQDLKQLRDEGYAVEIKPPYLLIKNIPYVNANKEIKYGILVSELTLKGDITATPNTHVAYFVGEHPCKSDGSPIDEIKHQSEPKQLDRDLLVQHSFSSKPEGGYKNFHEKMGTYIAIISSPAIALNSDISAQTYPVIESEGDDSVFAYIDTASSRAEITDLTRKLELNAVAIVGLGGTGSYVLDFLAKTPVREIHLFDADKFSQHNAFRSPGAASIEELRQEPSKVNYFKNKYSLMHKHIIAHQTYISSSNVDALQDMDFVFLCLDTSEVKIPIVQRLEAWGIPFIDVGMGLEMRDNGLGGILRVTTSTVENRQHVWEKHRIPFESGNANDEYSRNIQIAELNALNAVLAIIKWKKLCGFYDDLESEHFTTYTLDGNILDNEDIYEKRQYA